MNASHVSLTNRRVVLLAVLSLVASLIAVGANAPSARGVVGDVTFSFDLPNSNTVGESGTLEVDVTMSIEGGGTLIDSVSVDVVDLGTGSATDPDDYAISPTTLTWNMGDSTSTKSATITVAADSIDEGSGETINLQLQNNVGLSDATSIDAGADDHTATITDDDPTPSLSLNDPTVDEAAGTMGFVVTASGTSSSEITFDYATSNGTATAGSDYTATSGTDGSITAGNTQTTINVPITNDTIDEPNETLTFTISNPGNATISDATGTGTITDNDATPTIAINDVTVDEGDGTATFTITRSGATSQTVTANWATSDGTAVAPGDYTAASGSISIASGVSTDTIVITIVDNNVTEPDETFNVTLSSPVNATIADGTGVGTINDDEIPLVNFRDPSSNAQEDGGVHRVWVRLTVPGGSGTPLAEDLVVDVLDLGTGSATAGDDYTYSTDTITFPAGTVDGFDLFADFGVIDDPDEESAETIQFELSVVSGGDEGTGNQLHTVTIIDDETRNIVITQTGDGTEVAEAGGEDTFDVHLTRLPTGTVTVDLTETSLADEFDVSPTSLTFTTSTYADDQTVTVTGVPDSYDDGDLNGVVTLEASGGGYDGVSTTESVTITDDDTAGVTITASSGSTAVVEGQAADTYTVKLNARPTSDVTVNMSYNTDELSLDKTSLTFTTNNWNATQTVSVSGVLDGVAENTETHTILHTTRSDDTPFNLLPVASVDVEVTNSDELAVTIEGPSVGAVGVGSTFMGVGNASGSVDYVWRVIGEDLVLLPIEETGQTFTFTPTAGGPYQIWVVITDGVTETGFFIDFVALGDLGGSIFTADIIWLAEEGITKGCNPPANDDFCPKDNVTRGQMAAFLVRFLGLTAQDPDIDFVDDNTSIFENDIEKLATAGITKGCNPPVNDAFCPNNNVTRGQMAAFLVRALGLTAQDPDINFTDDNGNIFENDIEKLATVGITKGCNPPDNTMFCPNSFVTREQMAAFLHRAADLLP